MAEGRRSEVRAPDGTRLAVYEWGNASGTRGRADARLRAEPLSASSRRYRSALADRFRLVAFDMRGHGASEPASTIRPHTKAAASGPTISPR